MASQDKNIHQNDTSRNCTMVKVTGFFSAVKIALDDAFVMIEVVYQTPQSMMSFQLTGALSDSAISCAFSLMLAFRPRTVWMASLKLFCRPCLIFPGVPFDRGFQLFAFDALLAGQRSLECRPCGRPLGNGLGVPSRETSSNVSLSKASCERSGNLYVPLGFGLIEERRRDWSSVAWETILDLESRGWMYGLVYLDMAIRCVSDGAVDSKIRGCVVSFLSV